MNFRIALFAFCLLVLFEKTNAQQNAQLINSYLQQQQERYGWLQSDISDWYQANSYFDKSSGLTYTYINQRYHNIIVFNGVSSIAVRDNKVVNFSPVIISHLEEKINADKPVISAEDAIRFAIKHINGKDFSSAQLIRKDDALNIYTYDVSDISDHDVKVQLVYQPTEHAVLLAWDVSIEVKGSIDWWNIRIDALNGNFIDKNNYTVECNFEKHDVADSKTEAMELSAASTAMAPPPPVTVPLYNVFTLPEEAPSFGSRNLISDDADPVASPYGWHDVDGIAGPDYTITNGNNVYAGTDTDANNVTEYSSNGGVNRNFNFLFTPGATPITNRDASVTNLFYMNNKIHDVLYHFGFDEVAGNFQQNNYGNGGAGNDQVKADAMDGSGTNNANFGTPVDGTAPRMQMYLWTYTTPQRDASFDNGVIAHEYGHGVSNRLTGGPANSSCLYNTQSGGMGEGWSDYLGLMLTMEPGDNGANARGIGTYLYGQTPSGPGIRRKQYSTDMIINPLELGAYGTSGTTAYGITRSTQVHNTGEIWCSALWDMTWNLIDDFGFDNTFTNTASGNYIALKLVLQGMKLQPCNPGFMDARNAILNADTLLYGGVHACRIWQAFARRGMGVNASQGGSSSSTTITADFALPTACSTLPDAKFKSDVNSLSCSNTVVFTNQSQLATSYLWSFGDATTSTLANPTHTYSSAGNYNVELIATNASGSDTITQTIYASQNPVASFNTLYSNYVLEGNSVAFVNQSTEACTYLMDFGDGNSTPGFASSHTFTTPGDYNVKLVATNNAGSDSVTLIVHVIEIRLRANFFPDKNPIKCGGSVEFINTSQLATSYLWDFGDQTTSTLQNPPPHQYAYAGSYEVKLIAYDGLDSDTISDFITVQSAFSATATATPSIICAGDSVQLNVTNSATTNFTYSVSSISYAPVAGTGTAVTLTDDLVSPLLPIGFNFDFGGTIYTQIRISSNGFITFNNSSTSAATSAAIPNTATPNNYIALAWADLNPANPGSSINYFTTGIAPNRQLVVNYNTSYFNYVSKPAIGQIILFEGSNIIELQIDTISVPSVSSTVQGIENLGGTAGLAIPGRNKTVFNANNEGWRFVPASFSYNWMPGNLNGAAQTVFPTSSTIYSAVISDGVGCFSNATSVVTVGTPVTVSCPSNQTIGTDSNSCAASFVINNPVDLPAANKLWKYVLSGVISDSAANISSLNNSNAINLPTGTTTITLTGESGSCVPATCSYTVTVVDNVAPAITCPAPANLIVNQSACTADASLLGTPVVTDNCSALTPTNNVSGNFAVGNHTVTWTVADASGNTNSCQQNVVVNSTLDLIVHGTNNICLGSPTATIYAEASGNSSNFFYQWGNGTTIASRTISVPGTFTVTVTDDYGCTISGTTLVQGVSFNVSSNKIRCNGASTGTATVNITKGTAPFNYLWMPGVITLQTANNLSAGTYTVTVTDGIGCSRSRTVTISENPPLILNAAQTGLNQATATASGGVPPYSYKWLAGPPQYSATATGLINGHVYKVKVTDAKNCTATTLITMAAPKQLPEENDFYLSPNPTKGIVSIVNNCTSCEYYDVKIYNAIGGKLLDEKRSVSQLQFDLSKYQNGLYLFEIKAGTKRKIIKVVLE